MNTFTHPESLREAVGVGIVVEGEKLKKIGGHLKRNWKKYAGAVAAGGAGAWLSKKDNRYKLGHAIGNFAAPIGLGTAEASGKEVHDRYIKPAKASIGKAINTVAGKENVARAKTMIKKTVADFKTEENPVKPIVGKALDAAEKLRPAVVKDVKSNMRSGADEISKGLDDANKYIDDKGAAAALASLAPNSKTGIAASARRTNKNPIAKETLRDLAKSTASGAKDKVVRDARSSWKTAKSLGEE